MAEHCTLTLKDSVQSGHTRQQLSLVMFWGHSSRLSHQAAYNGVQCRNESMAQSLCTNAHIHSCTVALTVAWSASPSRGANSSWRLARRSVTCLGGGVTGLKVTRVHTREGCKRHMSSGTHARAAGRVGMQGVHVLKVMLVLNTQGRAAHIVIHDN